MAYISLQHVGKRYQMGEITITAVDDISFEIEKGQFAVIVGPSGAGKTTVLNILGGMDACDSGAIRVDGQEISGYGARQLTTYRRYDIGFVFQFYNLVQNLTALENVELPLIYRGISKKERLELSQDALRKVGLEKRMNHKPSEMSGGQQQRVASARALASKPASILADEPTGNLDSRTELEVISLLKACVNEYGQTLVMITHDETIAQMADRILVIEDGKVVSQ